ncbi:phosphoribosyltransferase [Legionella shakespearei]|uniref:Hypoxanthine-guanine phosphoribosyltransferase n=1 Tax=Legionella shakespearei DSM 23087 TaxID=1122169 RepID=A0A0W0YL85_9GAMM|nr:phosphoribosyltransferase family protein [Legionella shakespearei]KTD57656.1 hypoxanthine-guanine phosphoribosyltransferase [Legionella shakespearei DSM 23087]
MGKKVAALLAELAELEPLESQIAERLWIHSSDAVDLEGTVLTDLKIKERVAQLADEIVKTYPDERPVLVSLMDGAVPFANLLCEALKKRNYHFTPTTMSVSSYGHELVSGDIKTGALPKVPLMGRHVIIVDDVCDTGKTLGTIIDQFKFQYAKSIKSIVLVDKVQDRPLGASADLAGFRLDKKAFVIGMGLDYLSELRDKDSIRAANPEFLPKDEEIIALKRLKEIRQILGQIAEQKRTKKLTAPGDNSLFASTSAIVARAPEVTSTMGPTQ